MLHLGANGARTKVNVLKKVKVEGQWKLRPAIVEVGGRLMHFRRPLTCTRSLSSVKIETRLLRNGLRRPGATFDSSTFISGEGRIDHLSGLLRQLANRIDKNSETDDKQELESAAAHGKTGRRQGNSTPLIVEESRVLYEIIADTMQSNLADMDTSSIVPDMIPIGDNLYVMLVQSLRAVVSAEPAAA